MGYFACRELQNYFVHTEERARSFVICCPAGRSNNCQKRTNAVDKTPTIEERLCKRLRDFGALGECLPIKQPVVGSFLYWLSSQKNL